MNLAKWMDNLDCVCKNEAEIQACHSSHDLLTASYFEGLSPERFLSLSVSTRANTNNQENVSR